jgi:PST family polysaccharide transporter
MSEAASQPPSKLDHAIVHGLAWTAGAKWMTQLITWASVLAAARLLSPSDFGLVEMAAYFTAVTNLLAEFGISAAVLQMPELDRRVVAQLNTVSVVLCTVAFCCSVAGAPLVAAFFRSEQLRLLVVVTSVNLLITGFQAIPGGMLQRNMDYRRLSLAEAALALVQAAVTVGCALLGFGYWSLVAGMLAGKAASAVLTAWWNPFPFALPKWNDIAGPLRLAWHVTVGRLAWVMYSQADGIIVGRTMGNAVLGTYRLAISLAGAPAEKISLLIMRVTGPLFANVQDDVVLVRRYLSIMTEFLALTVLPLTLGLAAVAPDAVAVILGPKWVEAVAPLRWLAVFAGIRTMSTLIGQVLTSLRFTRFTMWTSLVSFVVMPVSFYVASRWGPGAVAASWILMSPVTAGPLLVKVLTATRIGYREYLDLALPALAGSAIMVAAVLGIRIYLPKNWPPAAGLSIQIMAGGAVYCSVMWLFFRERMLRYVRFGLTLMRNPAPAGV